MKKGSYVLLIHLNKDTEITVGKKGKTFFSKGHYVYVGSAMNGIQQRIQRHASNKKKIHWHIDFLLEKATIIDAYYKLSTVKEECEIARRFFHTLDHVKNFGCTDCSCDSHLFTGDKEMILSIVNNLQLKKANL